MTHMLQPMSDIQGLACCSIPVGMRQLWATGWCHNRVRVVAASFLVKHLLLPWQWGLKHLWDCQVDADLECDALGWQYVAGCLAGEVMGVELGCLSLMMCCSGHLCCDALDWSLKMLAHTTYAALCSMCMLHVHAPYRHWLQGLMRPTIC